MISCLALRSPSVLSSSTITSHSTSAEEGGAEGRNIFSHFLQADLQLDWLVDHTVNNNKNILIFHFSFALSKTLVYYICCGSILSLYWFNFYIPASFLDSKYMIMIIKQGKIKTEPRIKLNWPQQIHCFCFCLQG